MSVLVKLTLTAALLLSIVIPFGAFAVGEKTRGRYKAALGANLFLFFGVMIFAAVLMFQGTAFAAEETAEAGAAVSAAGMGYLSAALSTGLSCLGGGIAVSAAASAALGAISEDSSILGKSLIFVGLAEGCKPMKMYLISDNIDTLTGMRLAGVEGAVVHKREELKEQLEHALADKEVGIILLTEKFGREFPEIIDNVKLERKLPLIVEIPDRHGTGRKPNFITSYVNEAIGLKL